jgi:outer membrane protein OmpA-like peptidoglycan-associated protein
MAVPLVLSYLGRRIRSGEMTVSALAGVLQRESSAIRTTLPAEVQDALRTTPTMTPNDSPFVGQALEREKSAPWLTVLGIAALLGGLFWLFSHTRMPRTAQIDSRATGSASRALNAPLGDFVVVKLPNNVDLNIPGNGVEGRLLGYIQDPARKGTTWFDFDRLQFNTGSATLRPGSEEQVNNIAAIMKAYPNVNMKIAGYTDNVGAPEENLKLSQDRCGVVVAELVRDGIAPDRLTAEGYGEQYPMADNSTAEGRARNRRVSMLIIKK